MDRTGCLQPHPFLFKILLLELLKFEQRSKPGLNIDQDFGVEEKMPKLKDVASCISMSADVMSMLARLKSPNLILTSCRRFFVNKL